MPQVPIEQAMQLAVEHHRAGRIGEAELIYRQILSARPNHAESLYLLATIASQRGRGDQAIDLMRQAAAAVPDNPHYHNGLGILMQGRGRLDEAIGCYQRALAIKPDMPDVYYNVGTIWTQKGRLDQAIACYQRALSLKPDFAEAHCNLANAFNARDELDLAIASYRRALELRPQFLEAHTSLGTVWRKLGRPDLAIASHQRALAIDPAVADVHNNLGTALKDNRQTDLAVASYRQALALRPDFAEAHCNLGVALKSMGRFDEAITCYQQALALKPDYAEAYCNMGAAQADSGHFDEAITCYQHALALSPGFAGAYYDLAGAYKDTGQIDLAVDCYRKALNLQPSLVIAHGNLLCAMHYGAAIDARSIHAEARLWNDRHARPLQRLIEPCTNDRDTERPLRIGYVSPDFQDHPVGRSLLPLLAAHDHNAVQVVCYAQLHTGDDLTAKLQSHADIWRTTIDLSDQQLTDTIRQDKIDILVDLALHTAGNRLLVFARKPAPVLVTWAGYPGTTGLETIDYRLTDPYLDPPDLDDAVYAERSVRLPHTFWCFDPLCPDIAVNAPPSVENGFVTFGCLNNFCKVNDAAISLWARVLTAVSGSRLMLLAPQGSSRQRVLDQLARQGISADRIEFPPRQSRADYLHLYHRIDIALDTFPYNGHTTSLDAYWMGVPVITLAGQTVVGRAGVSQLSNLALTELIARTGEQYVRIAVDLAADPPRLTALRSTLRGHLQDSPLMDARRFARDIEAAYRTMWRTWCAAQAGK